MHEGLEQSGFIPKTYAAEGIGFAAMKPLLPIWSMFRNIAFSFIVIALVIIGFLIMFRFKVNPQTVLSVENALPKLFITLLLITFSFAIAGFLIDLMYVITGVVANVIGSYQVNEVAILNDRSAASLITKSGAMRLFQEIVFRKDSWDVGSMLLNMLPSGLNMIARVSIGYGALALIHQAPGLNSVAKGEGAGAAPIAKPILSIVISAIVMILATLVAPFLVALIVIFISALFLFVRLLVLLFSAYFRIVINIMFSPLILNLYKMA